LATQGGWDPLKELLAVQKRMNSLFESALARTNFETDEGLDSWSPVCDVIETDREVRFCLELPGVEPSEIELRLEGDELVVEGERKMEAEQSGRHYLRVERSYGNFTRRFRVPSKVRHSDVSARFKDGVLTVSLPVADGRDSGPVRVDIQ